MTRLGDAQFLDELMDDAFRVRTYPTGRICDHDGCGTVLSVYNPTTYCGAHQPEPDPLTYLGHRFHYCPGCGEVLELRYPKCRSCRDRDRAMSETKACSMCGEVKVLDDFAVSKETLSGRAARCKQCDSERKRRSRMVAVVAPNTTMRLELK